MLRFIYFYAAMFSVQILQYCQIVFMHEEKIINRNLCQKTIRVNIFGWAIRSKILLNISMTNRSTRKHSSRMRTARFSSSGGLLNPLPLDTDPSPWMQTPCRQTPYASVDRMTATYLWKQYLAQNFVCGRNCRQTDRQTMIIFSITYQSNVSIIQNVPLVHRSLHYKQL